MIAIPALSFFLGLLSFYIIYRLKRGGFEKLAREILSKAQADAERRETTFALSHKERELDFQRNLDQKAQKIKERLDRREDKLDKQQELIEVKLAEVSRREKAALKVDELYKNLAAKECEIVAEMERLSTLTKKEAQALLFEKVSGEVSSEMTKLTLRIQKEAEEEGGRHAAQIIATAINRLALPTASQVSVVTVALPGQEMKGRVIGREGRNIRALEQLTGVTFVIDDTPNTVVISGFDPVRKEVAKQALKELIQDGRIHPTRIEEVVERTQTRVQEQILEFGEDAAMQSLVPGLHPELLKLLGKLHFRFSYGQNVLEHSIEVSHLMGMIAAEMGLDNALARRIGLLHDIGKAVSHEVEGSHALIGHDFVLRHGESEIVANGIGCHHEEILPISIEGSLCGAADKISASRPGARVEALEQYLKRSRKLEQISSQFEGVEHAYALQAGREIRVIVEPERFDDHGTLLLARDIAKKIEYELSYPGKIKVTVIREKRVVEYAT